MTAARGIPTLEVRGLACGYAGHAVLCDVSFAAYPGRATVLLGPNGVGKTTLFKTMLGLLPRLAGQVLVEGRDTRDWPRSRMARAVAYVPQTHEAAFGFTVHEMVLMGRTPSLGGLAMPTREDDAAADAAIEQLGLGALARRDCASLSGGELQMVLVARALAQDPRLLVMDEPCANLDLGNQAVVLERVRALAREGLAVLVTSHDPAHALSLDADAVCVGRDGRVESGRAREMLVPERLGRLYGADVGAGEVRGASGGSAWACAPVLAACGSAGESEREGGAPWALGEI